MARSLEVSTLWICPSASSRVNAARTMRSARSACAAGIAQQMECSELPCEIRITEMPSSRSAPNSRCAVPGTPIMPAPSMFTSAMSSMVVMPFTSSCEVGAAQISVQGLAGAKVLRIQIGMARPMAGAMVCGWITLAPKYASSIALVVGKLVDDLCVGHAARIGRQHAIDVGPDVDLRGIEQRAEDRRGEVAAIASESRLHTPAAYAPRNRG